MGLIIFLYRFTAPPPPPPPPAVLNFIFYLEKGSFSRLFPSSAIKSNFVCSRSFSALTPFPLCSRYESDKNLAIDAVNSCGHWTLNVYLAKKGTIPMDLKFLTSICS